MEQIRIPVGRSDFFDIRENEYYYIDKSGLILELLRTDATQVTLITRPRRFGKTLAMSMLSAFFDIRKKSAPLFAGLEIMKDERICRNWMNQYPTLFLTFKNVDGLDFSGAVEQLRLLLSDVCVEHYYLRNSDKINEVQKERFDRLARRTATIDEVKNSLLLLTNMLERHYGKPVILLIDEYDVPLAKASEKEYYLEMLDLLKGIMQAFKDNVALKFAVVTGCLRIAKESIFTGTNNFVSDTISDTRLNEYFGFTQAEVERLLRDMGQEAHAKEVKEWYDGYHFGEFDVYCPWDVVNHANALLLNSRETPRNYWGNTSDNAIIRSFIDYAGNTITKKMETLLSDGHVVCSVQEDLTYDYLHDSEENLWSVLYLTGYLTRIRVDELKSGAVPKGYLALKIPNKEIKGIFETSVKKWFLECSREWDRKALFAAIWNGDERKATEEMCKLLRKTISYHDYREDFYHAFLAGIFAGAGYVVESNKEHGEGRSDVVIQDYEKDRVAIFEVKYAIRQENLENDCVMAMGQIAARGYAADFEGEYSQVRCYGIAFFKKRCVLMLASQDLNRLPDDH